MPPLDFPAYIDVYGEDTAGADTYTTVVTPTRDCDNILISVATKDAILSFDGGTSDHLRIPAGGFLLLDSVMLKSGVAIQGKNATAGQNYANLSITVW